MMGWVDMRRDWKTIAFLLLLTWATFWRVGQHEFINYDDPDYVTGNEMVKRGLTWDGVKWAFGNLHGEATYWHPLTWLSHMLDCQLFGLSPGGHHLMSLGLHSIAAVLLFLALRRLTDAPQQSLAVAALWAVHPLQVDTVAWVTERKNILAAIAWFAALWCYARYAEKPTGRRFLPVWLAMALGIMCKPVLATLPFLLLVLDFWPLRRWKEAKGEDPEPARAPKFPAKLLIIEKLPLLALSAFSIAITLHAHGQLGSTATNEAVPLGARAANTLISYMRYVGNAIWPARLSVIYPLQLHWPGSWVAGSGVLLVILTAGAVALRRRVPAVAAGWFWFLGVMVPTCGIVQAGMQAMADRFMYVPLAGLLIVFVWGGMALLERLKRAQMAVALAGLSVFACAAVASAQTRHWANSRTLFAHADAVVKDNHIAIAVLGAMEAERGNFPEAFALFERAVALFPANPETRLAYADALARANRPQEAIRQYAAALQLNPRLAAAHNGLGAGLANQGQLAEGIAHMEEALRLSPNFQLARDNLAKARQMLSNNEEVESRYETARTQGLASAEEWVGLGNALLGKGRFDLAQDCYRRALEKRSDSVDALNRLAWLLSTHAEERLRNGAEALKLAESACALTGQTNAFSLNTLAAAYAENGRFPEAVAAAQRAYDLAVQNQQAGVTNIIARLLEGYRQGQPYREMPR